MVITRNMKKVEENEYNLDPDYIYETDSDIDDLEYYYESDESDEL